MGSDQSTQQQGSSSSGPIPTADYADYHPDPSTFSNGGNELLAPMPPPYVDPALAHVPGIFTSDQCEDIIIEQIKKDAERPEAWMGSLNSLVTQTMPSRFKEAFEQRDPENAPPSPEEYAYTFWERIGAVAVNINRFRPRQYYYPYTDFRDYTYDEASPEELKLRAQWLSRMYEVSWQWPMILFATTCIVTLPLPPIYRAPLMMTCALTSVFVEGIRVYVNAGEEREQLDDFIVAKEYWYMKNVEALELGLLQKSDLSDEEREQRRLEAKARETEEVRVAGMFALEQAEQRQLAADAASNAATIEAMVPALPPGRGGGTKVPMATQPVPLKNPFAETSRGGQ